MGAPIHAEVVVQPMLNIAVRAARAAGRIIVRHAEHVDGLKINIKGVNDFVTAVDRQAEQAIIDTIRRSYPQHGILAEESGAHGGDEFQWVIDPLDGTTNFLHGFPQFAVSIALKHHGRLEQAVVFDPLRQELFSASRGAGAQLNDRRMRVSDQPDLKGALIGTGFPFRTLCDLDTYLATFRDLIHKTAGIRRAGAAALDLAYVATGRLDGFWEFGLKEWDIAAGALLIQEAGGIIKDPYGEDGYLTGGDVVAGNPKVLEGLLESINPYMTDREKPTLR